MKKSGLHLTPSMLYAAYELLRVTPPFRAWRLPRGHEIEFHVSVSAGVRGEAAKLTDGYRITISSVLIGTLHSLLYTMAHEMLHVHQFIAKTATAKAHNRQFDKLAARICRIQRWDEKDF